MDKVRLLEREMIMLSGPLAGFVIRKQIKDMGLDAEGFPEERMGELIDKVVDNGIYDASIKPKTKKMLKKRLLKS